MANQEYEEMMARYLAEIEKQSRKRLADAADLIAKFMDIAASKGVILGAEDFEYIQTIGIVAKAPGIARTLLGPIKADRDGLLPFKEIAGRFPPSPHYEGCFAGPDFILMAHPCYRRGMHPVNNWAPRFIDLFWRFESSGIKKYIALDENRVRVDVSGLGYFEADTWHGAPFDEDIRNIKTGIAKLRPPPDLEARHLSFVFADVYGLDIKWSESNGIKSFQALEMKTEDIRIELGGQYYFPRALPARRIRSRRQLFQALRRCAPAFHGRRIFPEARFRFQHDDEEPCAHQGWLDETFQDQWTTENERLGKFLLSFLRSQPAHV